MSRRGTTASTAQPGLARTYTYKKGTYFVCAVITKNLGLRWEIGVSLVIHLRARAPRRPQA